jgi:hypothetical protein
VNKDNTLAPLAQFLDKRGLIRLGGRTEAAHLNYNAKYPLLLHQKDPQTTTLARFIHLRLEHSGGPRAIITELNKIFWAPKSSMLFRKIAYGCIPCRKRLAKPTKQIMAPGCVCAADLFGRTQIGLPDIPKFLSDISVSSDRIYL